LEYTTQGIVGVYSNTEPYTYVVKNGINGILAENNPDSWYEALSCLIEDQVLRTTCLANAIQDIIENHSEQACIDKICRGIPEIREKTRQYKKCKDFGVQKYLYFTSRLIDWIYLLGFYFKQLGIRAVFNKIKTHFIEAKAYRRKDN
jgi:glycosyltransferase, group 1 family